MRQTQNTQKNSNKKSVFVIALLLLLVAVIGFGGYTLSKYVSSKSDNGTASVAKWGFTVTTNASDIFGTDYKYDTAEKTSISNSATGTVLTVSAKTPTSGTRSNLVAPGTKGSMTFTIDGTAEVKSHVAINLNVTSDVVLKYTSETVADGTYNPVKWTLKKGNAVVTTGENGATKLENVTLAQIATVLNGYGADVEANAAYAHAGTYTLEWAWAFDGTEENADQLDTLLGMVATKAGETRTQENALTNEGFTEVVATTKTTINFNLSVSVTQLKGNE